MSIAYYTYVCMYERVYVYTHVCMHACMYASMHACMHAELYVYIYNTQGSGLVTTMQQSPYMMPGCRNSPS